MKAPASLRIICFMCFIFVILSTMPFLGNTSGLFAFFTAICTIVCLLSAKAKSWAVRLVVSLVPLAALGVTLFFSALEISRVLFIVIAAVLLYFTVFMTMGKFDKEYWKFRKIYIGLLSASVFISLIYLLIYIAVVPETKQTMNLSGVLGFTVAFALMGMFVMTEMRSGEPDAKWRAKNAGRILAAFSFAAAALILLYLILSFLFSLITPTLGPHAPELRSERIRFQNDYAIGYAPVTSPNGQQVYDEETMKDDKPLDEIVKEKDRGFHWEYVAIGVIVLGAAGFFCYRYLKKKKTATGEEVRQISPEEKVNLDNIMKIRMIYRQYISFLRKNGIQINRGTTSEELLDRSRENTAEEDEPEPNPENLESGTEAEEKLREIYIRARYGAPRSISSEDAAEAAKLLAEITEPKE